MSPLSRRELLRRGALATAGAAIGARGLHAWAQRDDDLAFFIISDTHMLADATMPSRVDAERFAMNERLIDLLNTLPGQPLPSSLGGGVVQRPRVVLHLGDIADSGDKRDATHDAITRTEFVAHASLYGVTGTDRKSTRLNSSHT